MSNGIDKIVKERDCAQSALLAAQRQINEQSHQLRKMRAALANLRSIYSQAQGSCWREVDAVLANA